MTDLKELAKKCLGYLTGAGAEVAQCTVSCSEKREFNVDGGEFSLFRTLFNNRVFLTAFRGGKMGTISINRFDEESIRAAAENCLAVADSGEADPAWEIAGNIGEREFLSGAPDAEIDRFFDRTRELMDTIGERYPKVLMEQMIVSHNRAETVYADTSDNLYRSLSGAYGVSLMFSAHEGTKSSSFFGTGITTDKLDRPFIELGAIAVSLADVERQIDTVPLDGKFTGTVIFTPDCLGAVLASVVRNFVSDRNLINGTSIWLGKVGEAVADKSVTLSIAPRHPAIVCGEDYTDEGFLSEDYDLIHEGVLTGFAASAYAANKVGCRRAANTSGAYVMPAGDKTLEELIGSVEHGLLVARFSGGQPASNGDFSGVAKNSFLIENGKITAAVSETMISGNLAELLLHPAGATAERTADGSTLLPYAAFSGVTISGK